MMGFNSRLSLGCSATLSAHLASHGFSRSLPFLEPQRRSAAALHGGYTLRLPLCGGPGTALVRPLGACLPRDIKLLQGRCLPICGPSLVVPMSPKLSSDHLGRQNPVRYFLKKILAGIMAQMHLCVCSPTGPVFCGPVLRHTRSHECVFPTGAALRRETPVQYRTLLVSKCILPDD